ncbi:DUF4876 domain-containing protein [Bacteroides pyogenes]|uniref:DUF4876 domain-containing protein n=1 Tax=Bacteroides pyogenes TaxID=310300 RepID=UPI001BA51A8C|nr:DUF4876 domain-containing protein [Bacteroides pyogenes]MBR8725285.1 hypothetical protein [Bacteroides pyogenes]MBR8738791.1 hypothetical protein [Bacteroides pyogenes]MBR8754495.1 hypothetical protein [Bacteroides pyogenes]MBR8795873.1 hypothetical protein [Bacteroides pyogenes]MBR8809269.1 hypothetical protein [Bacteroides pyogenes]
MKNLLKSGLLLATIGLTVFTSCRRDGDEIVPTSKTEIDHLLIQEVYYTGTYFTRTDVKKEYDMLYNEDKYIKIYNPTSETVYLDNYALAVHVFSPSNRIDLRDEYNFIKTHFGVRAMVLFGGNGTQHPLRPGKSVLVAQKAIDHKAEKERELKEDGENPQTYKGLDHLLDLSKADFQWATKDENEESIVDKENVMQLTYSNGTWAPDEDMEDFDIKTSFVVALLKLGDKSENIKKTFQEEEQAGDEKAKKYYKNVAYTISGHHPHEETVLTIPYDWVEDAVTVCPNSEFKWPLVTPKIDKGHKGVQEKALGKGKNFGVDKDAAGKALKRKHDGNKYVDDNNSTSDFEVVEASASLSKE